MNKYSIRVNNAIIFSEGYNEFSALKNLNLFGECEMLDVCKTTEKNIPVEHSFRWIYKVETLNGMTLAYIKRI